MNESFNSAGAAGTEEGSRSQIELTVEPSKISKMLSSGIIECPNCGQEESFYLMESTTYRAAFDSGVLHVHGNKGNYIDWIRCNGCEREVTMKEIELTRVSFS